MGAIVSPLPAVPLDAAPDKAVRFAGAFFDVNALGEPVDPGVQAAVNADNVAAVLAFCTTYTNAQMVAFLQALIGAVANIELNTDPAGVGYTSNDVTDQGLISSTQVTQADVIVPGTKTPYNCSDNGQTTTNVRATGVNGFDLIVEAGWFVKFLAGTDTPALQNVKREIAFATNDDNLALLSALPTDADEDDQFNIIREETTIAANRWSTIMHGIPWCIPVPTVADITAARV